MNKRYPLLFIFLISTSNLLAQPSPPQLQSPEDGATDQPTTITFEWSSVSAADQYQIQIDDNPNFTSASTSTTTETSISITNFENSTSYYWRVRSGENTLIGGVAYGDWSETRTFTTVEAPPPAPDLTAPNDGATDIATSPTLDWQAANRADTYQLQLSQNSNFSSTVLDSTGISSTEADITNLQAVTTYYWRVRGNNVGGGGDWSETFSFTTRQPPPPAVTLVAPEDGATEVSTTPTLDWDPVERADVYDLQVATEESFNNRVVDLDNVVSTDFQPELTGFTTYYWRARGDNDDGPGEWSEVRTFTTEQAGDAIRVIDPSQGALWSAGQTFTIRFDATNNVEEVTIEYKLSPNGNWNIITENLEATEQIYGWTVPDSSSVQAVVRVRDSNNPDINGISDNFILYPQTVQLQNNYSFGSTSSSSDYRLVGLPADANIAIDQLVSGEPEEDWKAFYDDGSQENFMVPFDGSDVFTLQPGRALFVVSKNDVNLSETAPSVELAEDTTYTIPLHSGWNMIANPFDVPISWEEVLAENGISSALWSFEGSYSETSRFDPYQGYYFFNQNDLDELVIPLSTFEPASSGKSKSLQSSEKQILTLTLLSDGKEKSAVRLGFDKQLNANENGFYRFAPPGNFQKHRLTITSEKFSARQAQLATELRRNSQKRQTFPLELKSEAGESIAIEAEGLDQFTSKEVVLINRSTSKSYDLKKNNTVYLKPEQARSRYLLVMGTAEEIEEATDNLKPDTFSLSQNYPNPFNGHTVIEYSIPQRSSNTPVRLEIYNVLGQKVTTLVNEQQSAGRYNVQWDAQNAQGNLLSSGTYFYRLSIGNKVVTKQLTLIK